MDNFLEELTKYPKEKILDLIMENPKIKTLNVVFRVTKENRIEYLKELGDLK